MYVHYIHVCIWRGPTQVELPSIRLQPAGLVACHKHFPASRIFPASIWTSCSHSIPAHCPSFLCFRPSRRGDSRIANCKSQIASLLSRCSTGPLPPLHHCCRLHTSALRAPKPPTGPSVPGTSWGPDSSSSPVRRLPSTPLLARVQRSVEWLSVTCIKHRCGLLWPQLTGRGRQGGPSSSKATGATRVLLGRAGALSGPTRGPSWPRFSTRCCQPTSLPCPTGRPEAGEASQVAAFFVAIGPRIHESASPRQLAVHRRDSAATFPATAANS